LATRLSGGFASIVVVCLAAVLLLGASNRQLTASSSAVRRATEITAVATRTAALIVDAETGLRGYSLVHQSRFLEPYRHAATALPEALSRLRTITARDPSEAARVVTLTRDAGAYMDAYAAPLAQRLAADPAAGDRAPALDAGKQRVDRIRREVGAVVAAASTTGTIDHRATAAASRATLFLRAGIGAVVLAALLLGGAMFFLDRFVAAPIARVALATRRLKAGDLSARVAATHNDEVGQLGEAFDAMAAALEEAAATAAFQQDEVRIVTSTLETRNAELETQTQELGRQAVALETQHGELSVRKEHLDSANFALKQRSVQLERSSVELSDARDRAALFARVAQQLSARPLVVDQAETLLAAVGEMTGAAVGSVYGISTPNDSRLHLLSSLGGVEGQMPNEVVAGVGAPGRAVADGSTIQCDGDRLENSFGLNTPVRHELHVPLLRDGRATGVLSVGRDGPESFSPAEVSAAVHLAGHAAASLANAVETLRCRWLADLNRAVLDAAGDAFHLEGLEAETILSNAAMERFRVDVLGLGPNTDQADRAVLLAVADRTANPVAFRARLAEAYDNPDFEGSDEFELIDTHRWVHRYTAPVRASDGTRIGRIFVLRETTTVRKEQRAKDDLMSTVSHELRTPLSAIIGFTELLLLREFDPDERREYLGTVLEQSNRLADLIADFLDLQRLEHGAYQPEPQEADLWAIVSSEVDLFRGQSQRHTLTVDSVGDGFVTVANPDELRRATANLLSNAIKYSPRGGEVEVSVEQKDGSVVVSVTDHGVGIPAESVERVFDRFYRVDNSSTRSIGGTGLGLALVRELVERAGGTVGVESKEARGSRFWFAVPSRAAVPTILGDVC
jgi:signal transduction histidine kinase/CHASE3 domain sensor protein